MKTKTTPDLTPSPIVERVKNFYDAGSSHYVKIFGANIHDGYYATGKESREEAQVELIRFLAKKAGIENGIRILDVGCGVGGSSIWLAKNMRAATVGITISPVQLEIARRLARQQKVDSSFYLMNAENMEFRDPFDVIWVVAALTHFSDQKGFFKSAQRFLKENGNLIIYDWMIDDKINNPKNDLDIQRVTEEMVLAGMYSHDNYVQWLIETGYQMVFDSDITDKTIQTWDINFSLVKRPLIREFISAIAHDELKEIRTFLRARKSIKNAMLKGKVKSFALIAEKR